MSENTPIDTSKTERIKKENFIVRMARGYIPYTYWSSLRTENPGTFPRSEIILYALMGILHKGLSYVVGLALGVCVLATVLTILGLFATLLYHAFMPMINVIVTSVSSLMVSIKGTVAWLGNVGTAAIAGLLGTGVVSIIAFNTSYKDPSDIVVEWLESVIYGAVFVASTGFMFGVSLTKGIICAITSENVWNKLTRFTEPVKQYLNTRIIIE